MNVIIDSSITTTKKIDKYYIREVFLWHYKTQYHIMMDPFDSHYAVEIKELIFPEYNENRPISVHMVMFLVEIKVD